VLVKRVDRTKETVPLSTLPADLPGRLDAYQQEIFQRAKDFLAANTHSIDSYEEFKRLIEDPGGFIYAHWCGQVSCELKISADTGATIRVIPFDAPAEDGACLVDGRPSKQRVLFARAY
jgi:prolyl-tRNA synthetase